MPGRKALPILSLIFPLLLLLAGCAARLPVGVPVPADEQEAVAAIFRQWQTERLECPAQFDAAATVTFKAWVQSGTISGFVQAAAPSHLKFVAVNPLGQPMLVLVTDGRWFRFVSVPEATFYEGPVQAKAFARYAPEGVDPGHAFAWLTGRLSPEVDRIIAVAREEDAAGYWLDLAGTGGQRHRILFDPRLEVVHRHLMVDARDNVLVEVGYEDFRNIAGPEVTCPWPGGITIDTRGHRGRLIIALSDWLFPQLQESDFRFEPPAGYDRIVVE